MFHQTYKKKAQESFPLVVHYYDRGHIFCAIVCILPGNHSHQQVITAMGPHFAVGIGINHGPWGLVVCDWGKYAKNVCRKGFLILVAPVWRSCRPRPGRTHRRRACTGPGSPGPASGAAPPPAPPPPARRSAPAGCPGCWWPGWLRSTGSGQAPVLLIFYFN